MVLLVRVLNQESVMKIPFPLFELMVLFIRMLLFPFSWKRIPLPP
jgi:hypothetical protein